MAKESEDELKLKQFHIQNRQKVRSPLQALHAHLQRSMFEAGECVAHAKWIPTDLFTCRSALQINALEHEKMNKKLTSMC